MVDADSDVEVRPLATVMNTTISKRLGSHRFARFARWRSLIRAIAVLIHVTYLFKKSLSTMPKHCNGWHYCKQAYTVDMLEKAKSTIIHCVQQESYAKELEHISVQKACF